MQFLHICQENKEKIPDDFECEAHKKLAEAYS